MYRVQASFLELFRNTGFWRPVFYAAAMAVSVVSLLPGDAIPPLPDLNDKIEHAASYAVLGALAGLTYRSTAPHGLALMCLILLGGLLELGQLWVPGRSAEWGDVAANAIGAIAGFFIYRVTSLHGSVQSGSS